MSGRKIDFASVEPLLTYVFLGTLIGARLGHCFFYEADYYLSHPLDIFKVWQGGLASHGGILGVIVSIFWYRRNYPSVPLIWSLDRVSLWAIMTCGFIRIGNLMNSEILGKPTDGSWGFVFTRVDQIPRHPTQIYESLTYLLTFGLGFALYKWYKNHPPKGLLFGFVLAFAFTGRLLLEFFKENQEAFEETLPLNMGQLLSVPFILVGLILVYLALNSATSKEKSRN